MMAHPEHEDPAMRDHDDEAAEMAAIKLGFEAAESALADAADAVGSALVDLTAADGLFELVPELTQCVQVLAMVQARVAERLAYLATVPGVAAYAPEQPGRHHGAHEVDRRLAGHPSARQSHSEFPHPFEPAESLWERVSMDKNKEWVCADCGHEQGDMSRCARCASIRVVMVSVVEDVFGADWRDAFSEHSGRPRDDAPALGRGADR